MKRTNERTAPYYELTMPGKGPREVKAARCIALAILRSGQWVIGRRSRSVVIWVCEAGPFIGAVMRLGIYRSRR